MRVLCLALALSLVGAVPISKVAVKQRADCCIVDPQQVDPVTGLQLPDPDDCRCFGAYKPEKEHQQCMTAAPRFPNDRLKRAWQAGCWCIDTAMTCQDFCAYENDNSIRVLKVNHTSGENQWLMSTVATEIAQPVNEPERDARKQCHSGCVSRGFCSEKLEHEWPALVKNDACPGLPTPTMFEYSGDAKCVADTALSFGESCFISAKPGYWCRTNKIECQAESAEALTASYNFVENQVCAQITGDPTKQPSTQPTAQPTVAPSPMPTAQPTMQPIGSPTFQGCNKYNGLATSCASSGSCSYDSATNRCEECKLWDGNRDKCSKSSSCGLVGATNQCLLCGSFNTQVDCSGASGCTWTGTSCT